MNKKEITQKTLEIVGGDYENKDYDIKRMTSSIDMILTQIVEEYSPIKVCESLVPENGKILFSRFKRPVREILSVKVNGNRIPYVTETDGITVKTDEPTEIKYHSRAIIPDSDEEEIVLDPGINSTAVSYGVASEYYMRGGLTEEAVFYKNRYDNSIVNLTRKTLSFCLKKRRFI